MDYLNDNSEPLNERDMKALREYWYDHFSEDYEPEEREAQWLKWFKEDCTQMEIDEILSEEEYNEEI